MRFNAFCNLAVGLAALVSAHPGGHEKHGVQPYSKREILQNARRGLDQCAEHLEARGINARAEARRKATVEKHRKLRPRWENPSVNVSHASDRTDVTETSTAAEIFNTSPQCLLSPEGEVGPYWVPGELVRNDVRENQPGVDVILDGQFIDINTCEPLEGVFWDIWNCNSTGVYAGVVESGNGNSDDASNIDKTFLRGVYPADSDGVVQFKTVFPGHYSGRTNHHHIIVHSADSTVLANDTLSGGTIAHVGQIFWDQDLVDTVEATYPYNTNNISQTTNADDHVVIDETTNSTSDPFIDYVLLGDTVADGLFGWITFGVNTSASYDPSYSFVYTSSGGIAETGGSE